MIQEKSDAQYRSKLLMASQASSAVLERQWAQKTWPQLVMWRESKSAGTSTFTCGCLTQPLQWSHFVAATEATLMMTKMSKRTDTALTFPGIQTDDDAKRGREYSNGSVVE